MSDIKSDEQVILFPTAARLSDDGGLWIVPIHGWVFEPETSDILKRAALHQLRDALGLDENLPAGKILDERLRPFLVDNERGKHVVIRIGANAYMMPPSAADGHFFGEIGIPAESAAPLARDGRLTVTVVTKRDDPREFRGAAYCVGRRGISVVSDIDDTIKVTEVNDKRKLLVNTFLEPFRAVEGMPELYGRWAAAGVFFHFVSSSPWQLYEPLSTFARGAGFPDAAYHLKKVRLKDSSVLDLLADPLKTKPPVIEAILKEFPQRMFVLVGDSGEKDPEVYGEVARRHPDQVLGIYIRDVTGEPPAAPRYLRAFRDVPSDKWQLFRDPATLRLLGEPPPRR